MDPEAIRRGRRREAALKWDLREATDDEEACPPVWVDLLTEVRRGAQALRDEVAAETRRFTDEPDIRVALARRERAAARIRERTVHHNARVRRLNLLAPLPRFQRAGLDPDELLRPLYGTLRQPSA